MFTILDETKSKIVVNRSKFLGFVFYCNSVERREQILQNFKKEYFDATHICFGHVFWDGKGICYVSSDDREPSGTAGLPIVNALRENNFINVLCVVVRFFGGVKLGVQNLSKAYKQCAYDAILNATTKAVNLKTKCMIKCDYNTYNKLNKIVPELKSCETSFDNDIVINAMLTEDEIVRVKKVIEEFVITEDKSFC